MIYPVDSTIQRLNNRGLVDSVIHFLNKWGQGCSVLSYPQMQEIPGLKKSPWLVVQDNPIFLLGR